jgi:hypothetical protein
VASYLSHISICFLFIFIFNFINHFGDNTLNESRSPRKGASPSPWSINVPDIYLNLKWCLTQSRFIINIIVKWPEPLTQHIGMISWSRDLISNKALAKNADEHMRRNSSLVNTRKPCIEIFLRHAMNFSLITVLYLSLSQRPKSWKIFWQPTRQTILKMLNNS